MQLTGVYCGLELIDVLQMLSLGKKTGTLIIQNSSQWVALVIDDGRLVKVSTWGTNSNSNIGLQIRLESLNDTMEDTIDSFDDSFFENSLEVEQPNDMEFMLSEAVSEDEPSISIFEKHFRSIVQNLITQLLSWHIGYFSFQRNFTLDNSLPEIQLLDLIFPLELMDLLLLATQDLDESNRYCTANAM